MNLQIWCLHALIAAILMVGASAAPPREAVPAPASLSFLSGLARSGESSAQVLLADILLAGPRSPDYVAALRWYRQAAEQGNAEAQFHLAQMYEAGQGTPVDDQEALRWLREASRQGDLRASCRLSLRDLNTVQVP
jgi:TPR repeat protein